ncbi:MULTISPECIES: alpha/beta hydrolase [Tenebrionibacter/Tenebrionicola group]|uniref:Alpha/beta hydrolase n=2 Tax=Tenebrionibacter/Tenebrionicola group TaxID=2969848 RepID=A0A8K0XVI7_9ENTR|nr:MULTISPECIES: alpha/beta hydrolase-fold protein [Tenebrionibacter/Tenebrionicola group]MBK4714150.1 alpha/beta hydrolase [Tenebrionibacter intestinalis]MBV5094836.1 alpha/beta hydrolase [Tenebrionicola larvae]
MIHFIRLFFLSVFLLLAGVGPGLARPNMTPTGPNIADTGSAFYHFRSANFDSADKQRHYKVWVAIPDKAAPQAGSRALFMLDGNAAMAQLDDALLGHIVAAGAPVLVAIGYQTPLPFDIKSRTLDYTPRAPESGHAIYKEANGGGSAEFRRLLLDKIMPWVKTQTRLNPKQLSLWGHSYGGLFVLDTLYNAPGSFRHYYAASASLGWGKDVMLQRAQALRSPALAGRTLLLAEGDSGNVSHGPASENKNARLAASLRKKGVIARYRYYPGLSHGPMFGASLRDTINAVAKSETPVN